MENVVSTICLIGFVIALEKRNADIKEMTMQIAISIFSAYEILQILIPLCKSHSAILSSEIKYSFKIKCDYPFNSAKKSAGLWDTANDRIVP